MSVAGSYSSSINTGLQQVPDLTDINQPGKLDFQFIQIYNAINILAQSIDAYTGNVPASSTSNTNPAESTVIVGNMANLYCNAATALSAGYLVTFENVSSVLNAKLALANPSTGAIAYGLTMQAAAINTPVQVLLLGLFNFGGSVTPGSLYYLSPTTPGGLTTTKPTTGSGDWIQPVGYGVDTDSIFFNPCLNPQVA